MYLNYRNTVWRGRFLRYAPLILWIGVVFFASTTTGSMSNTSRFIRPVLEFLFPRAPEEILLIYHGYIRKMAHLAEYGILAFWASRAFWDSSIRFLQKYWYFAALITVFMIASIDEYCQSFNSQRTGAIADVWLDCIGGIFVILIIKCLWKGK